MLLLLEQKSKTVLCPDLRWQADLRFYVKHEQIIGKGIYSVNKSLKSNKACFFGGMVCSYLYSHTTVTVYPPLAGKQKGGIT